MLTGELELAGLDLDDALAHRRHEEGQTAAPSKRIGKPPPPPTRWLLRKPPINRSPRVRGFDWDGSAGRQAGGVVEEGWGVWTGVGREELE